MRYQVRRIEPRSAARVGCALGWVIALIPALCIAVLAVELIRRIHATLGDLRQFAIALPTIQLPVVGAIDLGSLQLNLIEQLNLNDSANQFDRLAGALPLTFIALTFALVVIGAGILVVAGILFSLGYNLLASISGGLELELRERESTNNANVREK